jgi:Ribonuclease HepT-like
MAGTGQRRPVAAVLADIEDAAGAASEIVARGKSAWDDDRLLRLADAAGRLPDHVKRAMPHVPWDDIRDIRIVVDHVYHRIDTEALWRTLEEDVPLLLEHLRQWRQSG